jgi:hypothetical protein
MKSKAEELNWTKSLNGHKKNQSSLSQSCLKRDHGAHLDLGRNGQFLRVAPSPGYPSEAEASTTLPSRACAHRPPATCSNGGHERQLRCSTIGTGN